MKLCLHKRKGAVLFFWQAWTEGARLWIQQGEVGGRGDLDALPFKPERDPSEVLAAAAREPRADGFSSWPAAQHSAVVLRRPDGARLSPEVCERVRRALEQTGNLLDPSTSSAAEDPTNSRGEQDLGRWPVADPTLGASTARQALGENHEIEVMLERP